MFNWLFKKITILPSTMAQSIAQEFREGELLERQLDGHGISCMTVAVSGVRVDLSWYSNVGDRPRSISIDGHSSIPKGIDSMHIFSAAIARSYCLVEEDMLAIRTKMEQNS